MDNPDPDDDFAEAFGRYAPVILRYAQRRLDNSDAAWDVVTETFTSAWRHWHQRPALPEMMPWLYAIARNSIRDQWRSAERRRRLADRLSALPAPRHAADPADGVVLRRSILDALSRLPEADQEVLRLVAWEGQTDARALGLMLGLTPGSARSRVHRARRRLRRALADLAPADAGQAGSARAGDQAEQKPGRDRGAGPGQGLADLRRPGTGAADGARMTTAPLTQHMKEA